MFTSALRSISYISFPTVIGGLEYSVGRCTALAMAGATDTLVNLPALSQELFRGPRVLRALGRGSGGRCCLPRLKRFASEDAERVAGCEMTLDVEIVVDGGVNGQKALG
jgi:hypothetical protein